MAVQYTTAGNQSSQANGQTRGNGTAFGIQARVGWPTERWVGAIVIAALALLILIRFGFRGIGIQGTIGGRVNV